MELNYSLKDSEDAKKMAKGTAKDLNVSFKKTVVVCDKVRGMNLKAAIAYLEDVVELKKSVPFKRHQRGVGHRKGMGKDAIGKYPEKAAGYVLALLKNIAANAEYKGLDGEKLSITHIQANKGPIRTRRKPKGRWKLWRTEFVSLQAACKETKE